MNQSNEPVPFLDLKTAHMAIVDELKASVCEAIESGFYIRGERVSEFEEKFARYVGAQHCVGVGNGLDALTLSLKALNIQPGDEVIVPSHTYIATWLAVASVGGTLVPVEPDEGSFNISASGIGKALTPKTKAIVPVHLYGMPIDMQPIVDLARAHDVSVVEDAAQAHGARFRGSLIGSSGDSVCWSFYPGKNLGALGDAGAVTTNLQALAHQVRVVANYGSARKYEHEIHGVNSRLDELQAAALSSKLRHLSDWNARRSAIAARYSAEINHPRVELPHVAEGAEPVWHLYVVRTSHRDFLQKHLAEAGIQTLIHYPIACHHSGAFKNDFRSDAFPVAGRMADEVLSLPMGPHLDDSQVSRVIEAVNTWSAP